MHVLLIGHRLHVEKLREEMGLYIYSQFCFPVIFSSMYVLYCIVPFFLFVNVSRDERLFVEGERGVYGLDLLLTPHLFQGV